MITEWDCFMGLPATMTVPDSTRGTFIALMTCQRCHTLVRYDDTWNHAKWHNELFDMGAEKETV